MNVKRLPTNKNQKSSKLFKLLWSWFEIKRQLVVLFKQIALGVATLRLCDSFLLRVESSHSFALKFIIINIVIDVRRVLFRFFAFDARMIALRVFLDHKILRGEGFLDVGIANRCGLRNLVIGLAFCFFFWPKNAFLWLVESYHHNSNVI